MPTLSPITVWKKVRGVPDPIRMSVQPVWVGRALAVHPPVTPDGAPVCRGRWTLTHLASGMAAARDLPISRKAAVQLAREWDDRFLLIASTADAGTWPHREPWGQVVYAIRCPWLAGLDDGDGGGGGDQATALDLAAGQRLGVDKIKRLIRWRGHWWPAPTDGELQAWTLDSVCESPDGRTVEPDAPDSWLRILGLV